MPKVIEGNLSSKGLRLAIAAGRFNDFITNRLIEGAIDKLLMGRTAIIVAHHLTTVKRADDIMILDAGRVTEHGNCDALAADAGTRFHSLLQTGGMLEALS